MRFDNTSSPESLELDNAALKSAGTRNVDPNTFDVVGKYCGLAFQTPKELKGKQMEIWMGVGNAKAGTLVGHVRFELIDAVNRTGNVIIDLTDADGNDTPDMYPYVATVAHIHFASDISGIPQTKKGNPVPGQFEYNIPLDPSQSLKEIIIEDVEFDNVGAIHLSVVKYGGIEGFEFYLPKDPVTVEFKFPGTLVTVFKLPQCV